jgi:hypothetical protein
MWEGLRAIVKWSQREPMTALNIALSVLGAAQEQLHILDGANV